MDKVTALEAANILGINRRTLYRWEKEGKVKGEREGVLNTLVFDKGYLETCRQILAWNKKVKDHLAKLPIIEADVDKNSIIQDYVPGKPMHLTTEEEMQAAIKAFEAEKKWMEDYRQILDGIDLFPKDIVRELLK